MVLQNSFLGYLIHAMLANLVKQSLDLAMYTQKYGNAVVTEILQSNVSISSFFPLYE